LDEDRTRVADLCRDLRHLARQRIFVERLVLWGKARELRLDRRELLSPLFSRRLDAGRQHQGRVPRLDRGAVAIIQLR